MRLLFQAGHVSSTFGGDDTSTTTAWFACRVGDRSTDSPFQIPCMDGDRWCRRERQAIHDGHLSCLGALLMSIIFGVRKAEGDLVAEHLLQALAQATDSWAPDGTFVYARAHVGMG